MHASQLSAPSNNSHRRLEVNVPDVAAVHTFDADGPVLLSPRQMVPIILLKVMPEVRDVIQLYTVTAAIDLPKGPPGAGVRTQIFGSLLIFNREHEPDRAGVHEAFATKPDAHGPGAVQAE